MQALKVNRQLSDRERHESERVTRELYEPGSPLVWHDVRVTIKEKEILKGLSGVARPGEVLAILGPSGSGKTTLLNVLSGRRDATSGSVLISDSPLAKRHKRQMAYVLQQDLLYPTLTLRDTLYFTSELQLPEGMSRFEKQLRIDDLVESLDLGKCLDTVVGDAMIRGLSGGEKKRTNIACEMLTNPRILLLDEPTTGLDASTARDLIDSLKQFARSHHKTVVATIHQPSSRVFYSFDSVMLLCDGELTYYGSPHNIMDHFESAGLTADQHTNPADFVLEQLRANDSNRGLLVEAMKHLRAGSDWPEELRALEEPDGTERTSLLTARDEDADVQMSRKGKKGTTAADDEGDDSRWVTGFWKQLVTLLRRNIKHSKTVLWSKQGVGFNVALVIATVLLWFRMPRTEEMLESRNGMIFQTTFTLAMHPLFETLTTFPAERPLLGKERSSGAYRLSAYYCAKMLSELPLVLLQPLLYITVVYWACNLGNLTAFFPTLVVIIVGAVSAESLGLFISASVIQLQEALTIAIVYNLTCLLLGGFYIKDVPVWISWFQYVNFVKYAYDAMLGLEYGLGSDLTCGSPANLSRFSSCHDGNVTTVSGTEVLEELGVTIPVYLCVIAMFIFLMLFRVLGYFMLRFFHKPDNV